MRSMLRVFCAVVLLLALGGCAHHAGPGGPGPKADIPVTITLTWQGQRCKAQVDPDTVTVHNGDRIMWTVKDDCTKEDEESDTQLAFAYEPNTKKRWLDGVRTIVRTKKGGKQDLVYVAVGRGQRRDAKADYVVIFNGECLTDPKVVWGG